MGDASAECCGRGRPRPQPGFTYPARATTIPARRGPAGPERGPSPVRTSLPASPIGCRARDASGSANQRREARFGNFFPLGPGASPPSYGGAGREGAREVRAAGPEDGCGEGVQAAPCTRCHAPRNTRTPLLYIGGIYPLLLLPKKRQRCSWSKNPGL